MSDTSHPGEPPVSDPSGRAANVGSAPVEQPSIFRKVWDVGLDCTASAFVNWLQHTFHNGAALSDAWVLGRPLPAYSPPGADHLERWAMPLVVLPNLLPGLFPDAKDVHEIQGWKFGQGDPYGVFFDVVDAPPSRCIVTIRCHVEELFPWCEALIPRIPGRQPSAGPTGDSGIVQLGSSADSGETRDDGDN